VLSGASHVLTSLISTLHFQIGFLHFAYVKYLDQCNSFTKALVRPELLYGSFSVLARSVFIVANSDNVLHNCSYFPVQQVIFLPYPLLRPDNGRSL